MAEKNFLSSNMEDYLEAILEIISDAQKVRAKNIADKLGVRQPSVTAALRSLSAKELIAYQPYGTIVLTEEGRQIAERIWARHVFLRRFLIDVLEVEKDEANDVACKLEHVVSENVMNKMIAFASYIEQNKSLFSSWTLHNQKAGKADAVKSVFEKGSKKEARQKRQSKPRSKRPG